MQLKDEEKALKSFREAIAATPDAYKERVRQRVPEDLRGKL